jgi:hypothetical protein
MNLHILKHVFRVKGLLTIKENALNANIKEDELLEPNFFPPRLTGAV